MGVSQFYNSSSCLCDDKTEKFSESNLVNKLSYKIYK